MSIHKSDSILPDQGNKHGSNYAKLHFQSHNAKFELEFQNYLSMYQENELPYTSTQDGCSAGVPITFS